VKLTAKDKLVKQQCADDAPELRETTAATAGSAPSLWILGAGHFGRIAARRLARRYPEATLLVVDSQREKLLDLKASPRLTTCTEDAMEFLKRQPLSAEQWIIPAIPVHVAWLWLLHALEPDGLAKILPVPAKVDALVPNPYRVPSGTLYASYATFRCPDACNEPDELCTHTRQPRPGDLFEHLAHLHLTGYTVEVLRSRQLAPGVGGYQGAQLSGLLERVRQQRGRFLIATSCRCHAVIDGLSFDGE
jgi:hypothetical protein